MPPSSGSGMIEALCLSVTSVGVYQLTKNNIPEGLDLQLSHRKA